MVKKISGPNKSPKTSSTTPIGSTKGVEPGQIGKVGKVNAPEKKAAAGRVRRPTRPMTAAEREHLFKLIHEEADKMFGPNGLPESQRDAVESAVKQTISASMIEEEEDS